MIKTNNLYLM